LPKCVDLFRITGQRVQTRRQVGHAVYEEAQVDARAPGNGIPGHGSPVSSRHETRQHPEERRRRDGRGGIHAHGTPAPQDHSLGGERAYPNWRLEEFFLGRKAGKIFVDRHRRIRGGTSHLVDHGPIDPVLDTERIRHAVPSGSAHVTDALFRQLQASGSGPILRYDECQEFGMLSLRAVVVGITVESEQC
jgi:hypothetical protein